MWHEARRSERKVHDMMDAARRRAERRAVYLAKRRGDPQQSLRLVGTRCRVHHDPALYQATQDQQGLIPWNGRSDNLIDRFDGRALLDFIRENDGRFRARKERTEEEEELEERVNFERYRDLIKHRRRGLNDEEGLDDVEQELEAKAVAPFVSDRQRAAQTVQPGMGTYAQVGFAYDGEREDSTLSDSDGFEEDDEDNDSSSEDSEDEEIEAIGRKYGVNRFNWLLYMDRKAKEEEKKQKEAVKGDPAMRKLSRKERRKASQQEREREKEAFRLGGSRFSHHDPYREPRGSPTYEDYARFRRGRSRSRSRSPSLSRSRRQDWQGSHERSRDFESSSKKSRARVATTAAKIEYITEFGAVEDEPGSTAGISPPSSPPPQVDSINRLSSGQILEALHNDPAAVVGTPSERDRTGRDHRGPASASTAIAKLSKPAAMTAPNPKAIQGEKKETPQERLKRIMSKQLNKQIKKDTVTELAKRREQERLRQEKLAETRRIAQHKRRSRSKSCSRSRSPYNRYYRSRSRSRSRSPGRSHHRSPSSRSRKHQFTSHRDTLTKADPSTFIFVVLGCLNSGAVLCQLAKYDDYLWCRLERDLSC
ncbi:hypothetical protein GOP47_0015475 [Adiantum capillus-veneris]|uniref:Suppressor of white apricot N-terminal domain-containing protein n=1 Tax=Adiantum capillus-veneris TaxID=13818 RepID=A0A9D4ZBP5_ADICA|nr:hypothetical protein GOP47_0015475 [Adiantum capillus-veneris]